MTRCVNVALFYLDADVLIHVMCVVGMIYHHHEEVLLFVKMMMMMVMVMSL